MNQLNTVYAVIDEENGLVGVFSSGERANKYREDTKQNHLMMAKFDLDELYYRKEKNDCHAVVLQLMALLDGMMLGKDYWRDKSKTERFEFLGFFEKHATMILETPKL